MNRLINDQGKVQFGIFNAPVDEINAKDFRLSTPMGFLLPERLKKLLFNQFVFFGLTGPALTVGMAVVDLKYLANGFFYIHDKKNQTVSEANKTIVPLSKKIFISPTPADVSCGFAFGDLSISMKSQKICAKSKNMEIDLEYSRSHTLPLRICTRAGYRGWVYTEKTAPITIHGKLIYKDQAFDISSPAYQGLMDWTAGYMRRETFWNWAATASTLADGRCLGFNFSCGVNETSFTENAFWIDGKMTKVDLVAFEFDPDKVYDPWKISSLDGKVLLTFDGQQDRKENINAGVVATKFTQLMGNFNGRLKSDDSETIVISDCPGWVEDHYAKW